MCTDSPKKVSISINTTYVTLLLKRLPCSGPSCRPSLQDSSHNQCIALLVLTVFRHVSCTINISRHLHLQWKSLKVLKLHTIHTKLALGVDGKGTPALIGCPDVAAQSDAFHDKAWHLWIPWKNLWESYSRYSRPFSDGETAGVDADVTWFHSAYHVRFYMFFIISILKFQRASSQICDTTRSGSVTSTSPADIKLDIKCIDVPLTPRRWSVETAQTESDSFRPDLRWNKIKTWSDSLDQGEQRPKAGCWSFSAHFLKNLQNINFLQSKRCHRITSISLSAFSILFLLLPCHSLRLHSSLVQHIPRLRAPNPLGLLYYVDQLHPINGFVVVCWSISIQCANLITISDSTSESKATVAAAVHAATVEAIDEKYLPCRKRQVQSFTMSGCGTDCAYCNMG